LECELVGEVGGFFEGGEGLEVGLGFDGLGAGIVDGLDHTDRGSVVLGVGDGVELREGEAVDLADEDGGYRGIEEVFEEVFGEGWATGHWGLSTGGRGRRLGGDGGRSGGGRGALTPALSHQNGRGRKR
jgi:hypothetical protein